MARRTQREPLWHCSFWPEGDIDGPRPGVWIRATRGSHAASLFRIDLAGETKAGTIVVRDNKGREVHRTPWAGTPAK